MIILILKYYDDYDYHDFRSSKRKTSGLHTGSPLWLADSVQKERVSFIILSSIHHHHERDISMIGMKIVTVTIVVMMTMIMNPATIIVLQKRVWERKKGEARCRRQELCLSCLSRLRRWKAAVQRCSKWCCARFGQFIIFCLSRPKQWKATLQYCSNLQCKLLV